MRSKQWSIKNNTICILHDGMWFRLKRWKQQGYWITWSAKARFGERFGYERPVWQIVWQIGKVVKWRIACFILSTPEWYYNEKAKD